MVTPYRLTVATLMLTLLLDTHLCAKPLPLMNNVPHIRSTRSTAGALVAAIDEGAERSATLRALVERLDGSDVIAYVEYADLDDRLAGQLAFMSAAGGRRYVHVSINRRQPRDLQIAILGHELEHAVEIADAPEVIDEPTMARFYARVGFGGETIAGVTRFDTLAAIAAGRRVLQEDRRCDDHSGIPLTRQPPGGILHAAYHWDFTRWSWQCTWAVTLRRYAWAMSYTLTLQCGCTVYVACHPSTQVAHTRVIEARGPRCPLRLHDVGRRLFLWEMLPDPHHRPRPVMVSNNEPRRRASPVTVSGAHLDDAGL